MIKSCKCHGMSGSCTIKSCWMRINDFRAIGNYLKDAYKRAKKVESKNMNRYDELDDNYDDNLDLNTSYLSEEESSTSLNNTIDEVVFNPLKDISKSRLVYSEKSPNYCIANSSLGSTGTLGRHCSDRKGKDVSKEEKRSCRKLCKQCGYIVKKDIEKGSQRCNCTFQWCCKVKCSLCPPRLTSICSLSE